MEKITAFKANDGRLFETEKECLKWEKKLSQFPKKRVTTMEVASGITLVTNEYKARPHTKWHVLQHYNVMNLYKITYFYPSQVLPINEHSHNELARLDMQVIAIIAMLGTMELKLFEFDEICCEHIIKLVKKLNPKLDIRYRKTERGWALYDQRIYQGLLCPMEGFVSVEKL